MKFRHISIICAGCGLLGTVVHAKDPVLNTPGTASWTSGTTATGTRTVFTLTGNTVLSWDQLNLSKGSELEFNFVSGDTVVNFLGGTGINVIDGAVTSNGNVAFISPTADLQVNGSIIAKGVTLATLNADASDLSQRDGFELTASQGFHTLNIGGHVEATDGDVVLGSEGVVIDGSARIIASRDVLIGGSRNFTVAPSGNRRIHEKSGEGFVLHLGTARAAKIEIAGGKEVDNGGIINAGEGKIFIRVGNDGLITSEKSAILVGDAEFEGNHDEDGSILVDEELDAAPAISEATLSLPALTRPDGSNVPTTGAETETAPGNTAAPNGKGSSGGTGNIDGNGHQSSNVRKESFTSRTISYSVPMSASADVGRDSAAIQRNRKQVARVDGSKSLLQRSSFYGMRGGTTTITAKR